MSKISSPISLKRLLLIRTDRIGDTVLTLPSVSAIRKKYPKAFIVFLAQPYTAPLIEKYSGIDLLLIYEPEGRHKGFSGIMKLSRELEKFKFDTAILFYPRPELAFAIFKAKISNRIGSGYRWYSFLLNKRIFEHRKECLKHEAEYNLSLLGPVINGDSPKLYNEFKEWTPESWWVSFHEELNFNEYIIVHSSNGVSAPNLSQIQYRLIIKLLLEKTPFTILLTGTIGDEILVNELVEGFPKDRVKNMVGRFSLEKFFSIIRNSTLLITTSTGPLHLANSVGIPILGFFCPAKPHTPKRWGPYHQQEWVVTPKLQSPASCEFKKCPHGGCLKYISETEITEVLCKKRLKNLNLKNHQ